MTSIDFALGFIAGEASFTVGRTWSKGKPYLRPVFKIQLDKGDAYLLSEVQEVFGGIGGITERKNVIHWEVGSTTELQKLVHMIDKNAKGPWLASEKKKSYEVWKDVVDVYTDGNSTDQDRVNMAKIASDGNLNVGNGGTDANYKKILDWYAENRNTYPEVGRME